MRFETSQSTPPHLNRRLQLRMLSFVAMFAVVMFLVNTLFTDPPKKSNDAANRSDIPRRKIDFDVRDDEPRSLKPGEFIVTPPDQFEAPIERTREWLDEQAAQGEDWAEDAAARDREAARRSTRFNKRTLASVKDNTLGIRRDEADAYYRLLDHVNHVSPADLERAAVPEVQYINLMTEPDRFRGEPVTIQGDLWRLYEFEAGPNDRGLTTLYEAWIFTGDSSNHPYRVVCTSLPHTLTPGENIRRQQVRVTGYFFKREGYPTQDGMHVAPTLLAPTVTPFRPAHAIPLTDAMTPYLTGIVTAVGLALLVTLLALTLGDRRIKRIARQRLLNEPTPSFAGLDAGPFVTVEETLRRFSEQERQTDLRDEIAATGRDAGTVATSVLYRRDPHASVPRPAPAATLSDDELHSRQLSQANVLQSWTSRQQATESADAESRESAAQRNREQRETDRVLNRLDPATDTDADRSDTENSDADGSVFTLGTSRTDRSLSEVVTDESSLSLGTSKLAESEREVQQFSDRGTSVLSNTAAADERAARAQLQRDRLLREQELRDRLHEQRSELEQEQHARLERDRAAKAHADWETARADAERERSRLERERLLRDEQDRERVADERLTFDRADRLEHESSRDVDRSVEETDLEDASLTEEERAEHRQRGGRRGGWGWPRRRTASEESATDRPLSEEIAPQADAADESLDADDDSTSDDEVVEDVADGEASDNGTTTPKKTGGPRYNEQRSKNKRRRRRDNR